MLAIDPNAKADVGTGIVDIVIVSVTRAAVAPSTHHHCQYVIGLLVGARVRRRLAVAMVLVSYIVVFEPAPSSYDWLVSTSWRMAGLCRDLRPTRTRPIKILP